jgi:hypothetical protein
MSDQTKNARPSIWWRCALNTDKHGTNQSRKAYPLKRKEPRHPRRRTQMWLAIVSSALLLFSVSAIADSCVFSAAAPFQLTSDTVDWTMQIASGRSCTRGLKLGPMNISGVKLVASPQSGQVVIKGPSFSYTQNPTFRDSPGLRHDG